MSKHFDNVSERLCSVAFKSHVFVLLELKFNLVLFLKTNFLMLSDLFQKNKPLVSEKVVILGNR